MIYDQIAEAYVRMLCESNDLSNTLISEIEKSDRYKATKFVPVSYTTGHDIHFEVKKPDEAEYFNRYTNAKRNRGTSWYNPRYATLHTDNAGESQTPILKPEYSSKIKTDSSKNLLYRGMSAEEYESIMKTGKIKSRGDFNMQGQEGLTYYSTDPTAAQNYAHSFAPLHHKATHEKPAYVIAVKNHGTGVKISGTGEHEVGIPHEISASGIEEVHQGVPYAAYSGTQEYVKDFGNKEYREASGTHPISHLVWSRIK
jgi:hypothetical protein